MLLPHNHDSGGRHQVIQRLSFSKELLTVDWLQLKILIPLVAWADGCICINRQHLMAAQLVLYGGLLLGMVVYFAYSKWKRQRSAGAMYPMRQAEDAPLRPGNEWDPVARMPLDYLQPDPLRLSEAPFGDDLYIDASDVTVDRNGPIWVGSAGKYLNTPVFQTCRSNGPRQVTF